MYVCMSPPCHFYNTGYFTKTNKNYCHYASLYSLYFCLFIFQFLYCYSYHFTILEILKYHLSYEGKEIEPDLSQIQTPTNFPMMFCLPTWPEKYTKGYVQFLISFRKNQFKSFFVNLFYKNNYSLNGLALRSALRRPFS